MGYSQITFVGDDVSRGGTYVLRIRVTDPMELVFGGFKRGKVISVEAGDHSYVGSAVADKGAVSLGRRLVRHATRVAPGQPHPIRDVMVELFPQVGLADGDLLPRQGK